jgi:FemAB-related protein (PEP-CTERM system-associated)
VTLTVRANAIPPSEWDAFVRKREGWTTFHLAAWKPLLERVFGHDCHYLAAVDEVGQIQAVLPLVRVRSLLFGQFVVSMPYVNYGGPLGSAEGIRAVSERAASLATESGAKLLELRNRSPLPIEWPVSHRKITVLMDLEPGHPEDLLKRLSAKVRSQVRRPAKEGVTVKFGRDQVGPFYQVFARHMRDLGTPVLPRRFFEDVADSFGEEAWFACAWLGGVPVACGAGFVFGSEVEITWASSLREHNRIAPNMALYWAFMERACELGLKTFNFGRCTPGSGTHKFKLQWGGRDEPLWWYDRSRVGGNGGAATPSPDDGAYSWGPRIWRRLPVSVATALGPRIVRGIP